MARLDRNLETTSVVFRHRCNVLSHKSNPQGPQRAAPRTCAVMNGTAPPLRVCAQLPCCSAVIHSDPKFGAARSRLGFIFKRPNHSRPTFSLYFPSRTMPASPATVNGDSPPRPRRGGGGGSRGSRRSRGTGPTQRKLRNDPAPTGSVDTANTLATPPTTTPTVTEPGAVAENTDDIPQDDDTGTCHICAESVRYYSVSECDHRTCHICAIRMRALWKRQDCTMCKVHLYSASRANQN